MVCGLASLGKKSRYSKRESSASFRALLSFTVMVSIRENLNRWLAEAPVGVLQSSSGHTTWDAERIFSGELYLTENTILDNPSGLAFGLVYILKVTQNTASAKTLGFGNCFKWPGGVVPTISTTLGAVDIFSFVSDGTNLYGVIQQAFA